MTRKKFKPKKSKYEDEAVIVTATISKIDYIGKEVGEKLKNVFYCSSNCVPEGRMCIAYGRYDIDVGDELTMKGRFNDGIFLVWSMQIRKARNNGL